MSETPPQRLARVLRILADVAERGPLFGPARKAIHAISDYEREIADDLVAAEHYATEAARLAGIDVSPLPAPYQAPEVQS